MQLLVVLHATIAAQAGSVAAWEIHDSLGHEWKDELLYYDIELAPPVDRDQPLFVEDRSGKVVSVQILERALDDQGQVNRVGLALITDLAPFAQRRFFLKTGAKPAATPDLSCVKDGDRWLLSTSKIGVAIPAGQGAKDERPSIGEVPAPILSIRGHGSDWVGKGWFTGEMKVVAWRSEVLATGPVFAWARISYDLGQERKYEVDIRVPAGQPVVLVREERNLPAVTRYTTDPAAGAVFHLALAPGLKPNFVFSKRELGSQGHFVELGSGFKGTYLTPAQMHWAKSCCNIVGVWRGKEKAELTERDAGRAEEDEQMAKEMGENKQSPFIGLFPRFLSHWSRPHHTFIPLVWDKGLGLVARFFLNHGSREWGLMAGGHRDMVVKRGPGGEGRFDGYYDALLLNNKWGETPLDKVKDWVLDWGDVPYGPGRKYEQADIGRGTMTYFAEQFLRGGQKWHETYIHQHQCWTGECDAWEQYRKAVEAMKEPQLLSARAGAAFTMYKQTDQDYWPSKNWIGPANPNMIFMGNAATLMGALAIHDHPKAKEWAAVGLKAVKANLFRSTSVDGAWIECPGYDGAGAQPILRAALDLHRTGLGDLLSDGHLLKVCMYHANLVTPPDPRTSDNGRHLPEYGDSWGYHRDKLGPRPTYWKRLVPILKHSHPREMGQILWALGEKEGPVPIVPIDGKSRWVRGFGSVFRHGFDTPHESYLAIHQNSFGYGHYHFDLGSLYFFGKGAPLVTDWPSCYSPQIKEAWMHNTVSVARMARFAYRGRVKNAALLPRVDYTRSRVYYDRQFPPRDGAVDDGVVGDLPDHCWQRQVLFVKSPDPAKATYLVVRDAVKDERFTEWSLWTLSRKLRLRKRHADVEGLFGVDLTVHFFIGPDEMPSTELFGFQELAPALDRTTVPTPDDRNDGEDTEPLDLEEDEEEPRERDLNVREVVTKPKYLVQQNVVRMKCPKGGQYGAVIYPRRPKEQVPKIAEGPEGSVTVSVGDVSETALLYPSVRKVQVGDISFHGRAAVVSRAGPRVELHLLEGQSLKTANGLGIQGDGPVSLVWSGGDRLEVCTSGAARELRIECARRALALPKEHAGVRVLQSGQGRITLKVPPGEQSFTLK